MCDSEGGCEAGWQAGRQAGRGSVNQCVSVWKKGGGGCGSQNE